MHYMFDKHLVPWHVRLFELSIFWSLYLQNALLSLDKLYQYLVYVNQDKIYITSMSL